MRVVKDKGEGIVHWRAVGQRKAGIDFDRSNSIGDWDDRLERVSIRCAVIDYNYIDDWGDRL